jgi:hypothetical protein
MAIKLRQSTAVTRMIGPFLDATDGVTPETGLAGNGTEISKDGAAYGTGPTLGAHDAEGWYPVSFTTTHTNTVGELIIKSFDAATHCPVWKEYEVIEESVYDRDYAASALGYVANAPVNVAQLGGDTQSATDLKDFADAGYDPATNKVQGVLLVDLTTDLTTKTGFALTQGFPPNFDTLVITASGVINANLEQIKEADLTQSGLGQLAGGFSHMFDSNTPMLTVDSINQTGDSFARIAANGSGLTALGDTRIANLDATVSSRAATGAAMTLANNAITTASINDGAITDAKFTVPTVTGVATGVLSRLVQIWMYHYLPSEYDPDAETFTTFATNGTTVVTTQSATVVGNVQRKGNAT